MIILLNLDILTLLQQHIMGITKKYFYSDDQIMAARLFKALGHPARITIVEILLSQKDVNCSDLQKTIKLSKSTISQHLKELHEVGVLGVEVRGNCAYYVVDRKVLQVAVAYIDKLLENSTQVDRTLLKVYFNTRWGNFLIPTINNT